MTAFDLRVYRTSSAYIAFSQSDSYGRVIGDSRELEWSENEPARLSFRLSNRVTGTDNFLNSGFNLWTSGTGPFALGQRVEYWVYPTSTGSQTKVFEGFITDMQQGTDGILTVTCMDDLYKIQERKVHKTVFSGYTDCVRYYRDTSGGIYRMGAGSIPSDIVMPPVIVRSGDNNIEYLGAHISSTSTPNSDTGTEFNAAGRKVVQALAPHSHLGWVRIHIKEGASNTCSVKVSIQEDSAGYPSGTTWDSREETIVVGSTTSWHTIVPVLYGNRTTMDPAKRYWLVLEPAGDTTTIDVMFGCDNNNSYVYPQHQYYSGSWNSVDACLLMEVYYADDQDIEQASTYYSSGYVYMPTISESQGDAGGLGNAHGMMSYYTGTVTLEDIASALIGYGGYNKSISTDADRTFQLYRTRGQTILQCLQEVAETFETSGTYSGRQHCFITRHAIGGATTMYFGFRKKLTDTEVATFSRALDTSTDSERYITRLDFRKQIKMRPNTVQVIGKDYGGRPIIRSVDDRGLTSSLRTATGVPVVFQDFDDSLRTKVEVDTRAWTILKSYSRDAWEGRVTLAGVWPQVRDFGPSGQYCGSGQIIKVNWAPLGISESAANNKFKVKGFRMGANSTEVQLTNADTLLENTLTRGMGKAYKSESFISPDDMQTDYYYELWDSDATKVTAASWMDLHDGTNVITTRKACTLYEDSDLNLAVYHCEFEVNDGHTHSGVNRVTRVRLWNTGPTGGSVDYYFDIPTDEQFDKWQTMRVIVEYKMPRA